MTDRFTNLKFIGEGPEPGPSITHVRSDRSAPQSGASLGPESEAFFDSLCGTWGIDAAHYRESILTRRQGACLRALGASSPADGIAALADAHRAERALGALMIGVTGFFRDPAVFLTLGVLLPLLEHADRPLRVLSVGCSDGSELYSVAILLAERDLLGRAQLHGFDVRPAALDVARAGVYPAAAVATLPPECRERYFLPAHPGEQRHAALGSADLVRVADKLRDACTWTAADAFGMGLDVPFGGGEYDLVLCRNLVIYLKNDSAARLWQLCTDRLRPGGLLVTGKAERPPAVLRHRLRSVGACIYRRRPSG
jgi:chemotaxis protein methyltransferase CheR